MKVEGKYVGILGYARTGRALKRLIERVGGKAFVSDLTSPEADEWGDNTYRILMTDLLSPSPGIPPHNRILARAETSEIPIVSELEIGWYYLKGKVIGITGTNGKSTVAHFTHNLLPGSFIGGNWGVPTSDLAFKEGTFVLEISSFQLHYVRSFRSDVAVITNVSPDHLDWHGSFEAYLSDKLRILENQTVRDVAVLNRDDPHYRAFRERSAGEVITVSLRSANAHYYSDGRWAFTPYGRVEVPPHLRSVPILYDLLMAMASSIAAGGETDRVFGAVPSLSLLPHRVTFVGEVSGVKFYDDSKGTNPGATEMALRSFQGRVVLIMGGDDKGLDLSVLRGTVREKVAVVVAVGRNRENIASTFGAVVPVLVAEDYGTAVRMAYGEAKRLGVPVLLSPACASFDMFKNYRHRSEVFRREVMKLKGE